MSTGFASVAQFCIDHTDKSDLVSQLILVGPFLIGPDVGPLAFEVPLHIHHTLGSVCPETNVQVGITIRLAGGITLLTPFSYALGLDRIEGRSVVFLRQGFEALIWPDRAVLWARGPKVVTVLN